MAASREPGEARFVVVDVFCYSDAEVILTRFRKGRWMSGYARAPERSANWEYAVTWRCG